MEGWVAAIAGRLDNMSRGKLSLVVEHHRDGDVQVSICFDGIPIADEQGNRAVVEFCTVSGGGGDSLHTHRALVALIQAMLKDAQERPEGIPRYPIQLRGWMGLGEEE